MNSAMHGVANIKLICFDPLKCVFGIYAPDSAWRSDRILFSQQFWMYVAIEP
jgi:hypothetical protein